MHNALPKGQCSAVPEAVGAPADSRRTDPRGRAAALKRLVEPATLGDPMRPLIVGVEEHGEACRNA